MSKQSSTLFKTQNNLSPKTRQAVIELLNQHLADILDLGMQAKQAHWNVKGPSFIALHELFDKVADELESASDEIAERLVALGGVANGTVQVVAKQTSLKSYPLDIASGSEHVAAIGGALAAFGASVRAAIDKATALGDAGTADLYTGISRDVDKLLWMVEAHAQAAS